MAVNVAFAILLSVPRTKRPISEASVEAVNPVLRFHKEIKFGSFLMRRVTLNPKSKVVIGKIR